MRQYTSRHEKKGKHAPNTIQLLRYPPSSGVKTRFVPFNGQEQFRDFLRRSTDVDSITFTGFSATFFASLPIGFRRRLRLTRLLTPWFLFIFILFPTFPLTL